MIILVETALQIHMLLLILHRAFYVNLDILQCIRDLRVILPALRVKLESLPIQVIIIEFVHYALRIASTHPPV